MEMGGGRVKFENMKKTIERKIALLEEKGKS